MKEASMYPMFLKFHWGEDFRVSLFNDYVYVAYALDFLILNKSLQQFK